MGHLFQVKRGTKVKILREQGNKTILENREYKKSNFRFLWYKGTSQFSSGGEGNRQPPWEGLSPYEHALHVHTKSFFDKDQTIK